MIVAVERIRFSIGAQLDLGHLLDDRFRPGILNAQPCHQELLALGRHTDAARARYSFGFFKEAVEIEMGAFAKPPGYRFHNASEGLFSSLRARLREATLRARGQFDLQAQGPLDRHLPVTERRVGEYLRLLAFLTVEEAVADALDVIRPENAVLLAEVFPQRFEPRRRVNQLDLALAGLCLAIAEHPNVGRDAGVVEDVQRQRDDGLEPIRSR